MSTSGSTDPAPSPAGNTRRGRVCQRGAAPKRLITTPPAQIRFLHQVFGVLDGAQHPVAMRYQLGPKRCGLLDELLLCRHGDISYFEVGISCNTDTPGGRNSSPRADESNRCHVSDQI